MEEDLALLSAVVNPTMRTLILINGDLIGVDVRRGEVRDDESHMSLLPDHRVGSVGIALLRKASTWVGMNVTDDGEPLLRADVPHPRECIAGQLNDARVKGSGIKVVVVDESADLPTAVIDIAQKKRPTLATTRSSSPQFKKAISPDLRRTEEPGFRKSEAPHTPTN